MIPPAHGPLERLASDRVENRIYIFHHCVRLLSRIVDDVVGAKRVDIRCVLGGCGRDDADPLPSSELHYEGANVTGGALYATLVTPAPTVRTIPERSEPGVNGNDWPVFPSCIHASHGPTPAAWTSTTASPGFG